MKLYISAMIVICFVSTQCYADLTKGSQTVAIFGGEGGSSTRYDFEPGDERVVTGGGGAFGGQYLYYLKDMPAIAIGADLNSSLNGNRRSGSLLFGYESTDRIKSLIGLVVARLSYPRGLWRPYIFGGIGAHNTSQQLSAVPQAGVTWPGGGTESRMLIDDRETSVAVGYGIGMDIYPTETYFFGLELRGTWLGGVDTDDTAALRTAGIRADTTRGIEQGNLFFRAGVKF